MVKIVPMRKNKEFHLLRASWHASMPISPIRNAVMVARMIAGNGKGRAQTSQTAINGHSNTNYGETRFLYIARLQERELRCMGRGEE
jgi:hypothetical protein